MKDFEQKLEKYGEILISIGCNIQPGKRLMISAPLEAVDLVRVLVKKAYEKGAKFVAVDWHDELTGKLRYEYAQRDSFGYYPDWKPQAFEDLAKSHDALLSITGGDPELLKDQDQSLVQTVQRVTGEKFKAFRHMQLRNELSWCIGAYPVSTWAAKVFPDDSPEIQKQKLWQAIFATSRIENEDPIKAWKDHLENLNQKADYMNSKQYDALHYRSDVTDLVVGLPKNHKWCGADDKTVEGNMFIANIPTEEIFTLPDRDRVDGFVKSTKPLNYGGILCENFVFEFKDGKAVSVKAEKGQEALEKLLEIDESSAYLGEVALVPHSSPISASGLLFYNTLFDENASSHLALGTAYNFTLENGNEMDEDEFKKAGGNVSIAHTDFMIGSDKLDIDGITKEGTREPVMRKGEWAF